MVATAFVLTAILAAAEPGRAPVDSVEHLLSEESADVFLAKATLQQYLSRVVRKDWDGARRLTHPKAMAVLEQLKKRTGAQLHNLAPWANREVQLKTFHFVGANQIAPGAVLIQVNEDTYRTE